MVLVDMVLRLLLIIAIWMFTWKLIKPTTQFRRILRAALLLLTLLGVLYVLRSMG